MPSAEPFLGRQAVRAGLLTRHQLNTRYRRVYRNVYVDADAEITASIKARAAWLWAGGNCVLVGHSAAAMLGTKWLTTAPPAELVRAERRSPPGIRIRSYALAADQTVTVDGLRVSTPARTAYDIGRELPASRAVPILDALLRSTGCKVDEVTPLIDATPGARGVRRLRQVLALCDPGAESPPESRVRMMLVAAGIPPPQTQIEFYDEYGHAFIRIDMGWPTWKVAVEYDGVQHWTNGRQRAWDIERIAYLESQGWVVIRISAAMLARPEQLIARVQDRLRVAGCPI